MTRSFVPAPKPYEYRVITSGEGGYGCTDFAIVGYFVDRQDGNVSIVPAYINEDGEIDEMPSKSRPAAFQLRKTEWMLEYEAGRPF